MTSLIACNVWQWIEEYRRDFEPPVGKQVIWEDSQFIAMIIRGPHARHDDHADACDEVFDRLNGDMILEYMHPGKRHEQVIRDGKPLFVPALTPHRPADTCGLAVEVTNTVEHTE